jgi:hypothetical protein
METTPRYINAPICDDCWIRRDLYGRPPVRLREPEQEDCHFCGRKTLSGIYVRWDTKAEEANR